MYQQHICQVFFLLQLAIDVLNQLVPPRVYRILGVIQLPTFLCSQGFCPLERPLRRRLLLEGRSALR
jgi:hypothetical protein